MQSGAHSAGGLCVRTLALAAVLALVGGAGPVTTGTRSEEASPQSAGLVNFSFDRVDVRAFVRLIGELTGRRFVVDEAVKGQITVVAPPTPVRDVYPLFLAILESVGCSVVEDGPITRVVALPPRVTPGAPVVRPSQPVPPTGVITKVLALRYTAVGDLRKILDALAGREKTTTIVPVEASNHLIITDTAENVRRLEEILAELDQPGRALASEVVFLQHLDAAEFAQQYNALAAQKPARETVPRPAGRELTLLAVPRSNGLVLLGAPGEIAEVRRMLTLLDVEAPTGRGNLHAIPLRYISAAEASKSLNALLEKSVGKDPQKAERRRIAIEASVVNNALLVDAGPADFALVRDLVAQLDQMPQQVLIEVVIAEVSLSEELDIGVEMTALELPSKVGSTEVVGASRLADSADSLMNAIQSGVFPRGLTIGVAHGTGLDAAGNVAAGYPVIVNLNALQKKGKAKILSSVPLLAQNNREASVSVVNNIPVLKSTISGGSGTARDVIQNIERVDVGIKLKLTPHINPDQEVCMVLNPSIEAIIDTGATGTEFTPTIAKREVSTTVTVPSGRTIVLSGLIREDRRAVVRRIPLLGSLPLLGVLFRHTTDSVERTNLIVLVTPHVLTGEEAARRATEEWGRRTGLGSTNALDATPSGRR